MYQSGRGELIHLEGQMSGDRELFEQQWPDLAKILHRVLAARGISATDRDDIVQETALRLVRKWDEIDHTRPVWPLATTIALNLMRGDARWRGTHKEVTIDEQFDAPSGADVERAGLARLEIGRVGKAMGHLSSAHRAVLLQEVTDDPTAPDRGAAATKMLRMRARRRLASLLETASASAWLLVMRLRRSFDSITPASVGTITAAAIVVAGLPASDGFSDRVAQTRGNSVKITTELDRSFERSGPNEPSSAGTILAAPGSTRGETGESAQGRPVKVPIGNGGVEAEGEARVNDLRVEVKDNAGPAPVCIGGVGEVPEEVKCPD